MLTKIDKASIVVTIARKSLLNSFRLIIGYGMRKGIILPVLREDLLHRNQRIIIWGDKLFTWLLFETNK